MRKAIVYGYARVSTMKQSLQRQIENIKHAYPDAIVISEEGVSGAKMDRPNWNKLYKSVIESAQRGDDLTIVFDEVSRMSRNAQEGFAAYKALYDAGVNLIFLKESALNTENFRKTEQIASVGNEIADMYIETTNRVLMILAEQQIKKAFESAEWELTIKRKNTQDGVRRAQAAGKRIGRESGSSAGDGFKEYAKARAAKEVIKKHCKDFGGTLSDAETMKIAGCARGSYYKYKKQLRQEMGA